MKGRTQQSPGAFPNDFHDGDKDGPKFKVGDVSKLIGLQAAGSRNSALEKFGRCQQILTGALWLWRLEREREREREIDRFHLRRHTWATTCHLVRPRRVSI